MTGGGAAAASSRGAFAPHGSDVPKLPLYYSALKVVIGSLRDVTDASKSSLKYE